MKYLYLPLLLCFFTLEIYSQDGSSCDEAFQALTGVNTFTGSQNTDQWFAFTANQTGKVSVSSCGYANSDTYLKVYDTNGICGFDYPIVINDDFCGAQSKLTFSGVKDKVYFLVWQNKSDSQDSNWDFTWSIEESSWIEGEDCSIPFTALEGSSNYSDHSQATDQWFSYTVAEDGLVTISSCEFTTENTSVRIFSDCSTQMWGDDGCGNQSYVQFSAQKDQEYLIKWESLNTTGSYNWSLTFDATSTNLKKSITDQIKINKLSSEIQIELPNNDLIEVVLYNMAGAIVRQVSSHSKAIINCSDLQKGLYIVQVKSDSEMVTRKIIVD
nr:T9SS type A sorting domain-containing protein [uncultured Carboxylicivirga sp.]